MPKQIDLVFDAYRWCWHYQAVDIQKYADPNRFTVGIHAAGEWRDDQATGQILNFSCMEAGRPEIVTTVLAHHGPTFSQNDTSYPALAATTQQRNLRNALERLPRFRRILCVNRELYKFAKELNPESVFMPAGVDLEVFPYQPPREHKKLVVGWCGQLSERENTKGYAAILLPLLKLCDDQFEFRLNTRNHLDPLSRDEMREWYADLDVFLCTSSTEGTPMPPLEAMACGRPVITTPVGDFPEIIRNSDNGILLPGYDSYESGEKVAAAIYNWLSDLRGDHTLIRYMGGQAHQTIRDRRNWKQLANEWLEQVI